MKPTQIASTVTSADQWRALMEHGRTAHPHRIDEFYRIGLQVDTPGPCSTCADLNPAGPMLHLWHHTSPETAALIIRGQRLRAGYGGSVYFTTITARTDGSTNRVGICPLGVGAAIGVVLDASIARPDLVYRHSTGELEIHYRVHRDDLVGARLFLSSDPAVR